MKIELRARGVVVDGATAKYVERSLGFALGKYAPRVRTVRVRIEDLNGPKGGVDKRCVMSVDGDGFDRFFVEVRDGAVLAAVDQAANVASRAVARALDRARPTSGPSVRLGPDHAWERASSSDEARAD